MKKRLGQIGRGLEWTWRKTSLGTTLGTIIWIGLYVWFFLTADYLSSHLFWAFALIWVIVMRWDATRRSSVRMIAFAAFSVYVFAALWGTYMFKDNWLIGVPVGVLGITLLVLIMLGVVYRRRMRPSPIYSAWSAIPWRR